MVARPEVGAARPSSSRMVVDFPAPFGPRNPVMRPGASSKDRSLTAVTVPYRLVSAWTAMVLMAVPPEVVTVVRWMLSTLGGAAARGAGRQDALSRTTAAYRIGRGMYAGGGPPGQPPGVISPDSYAAMTSWARSRRPSLARIRLTWVLAVAGPTTHRPAISALERPCPISTSTSRSRPVSSPASRASGRPTAGRDTKSATRWRGDAGGSRRQPDATNPHRPH